MLVDVSCGMANNDELVVDALCDVLHSLKYKYNEHNVSAGEVGNTNHLQ